MQVFKKIGWLFLFLIGLLIIQKTYITVTGDFRLANICYEETAFSPKAIETKTTPAQIKKILDQPYHFLGQGNQSYAFESQDGGYVLKFFKFGHLKKNRILSFIPFLKAHLEKANEAQQKRFFKVFEGYKIAYEVDPENAALLFIHLNKTTDLKTAVVVKDFFGFSHTISLDEVVFIVQEKVIPTKKVLTDLLNRGDVDGAKTKLRELLNLYMAQYKQGIYDRDHNLIYNTGFKGDQAIRLDVGKLRKNEAAKNPDFYKKDLEKIVFERIEKWLKKYYPHYRQPLVETMKIKLEEMTSDS